MSYKVIKKETDKGGLTVIIYRCNKHVATIEVDILDRIRIYNHGAIVDTRIVE